MSTRLIELFGSVLSILHKGPEAMVILFEDDYYGNLVCTITSENIFYYCNLERRKKYHLQVSLMGKTKLRSDGSRYTRNNLVVRKAELA